MSSIEIALEETPTKPPSSLPFKLAGIGASAGSLDALQALVAALPSLGEISYIIVQHASPTDPSKLSSLLGSATSLAVQEVTNGKPPEPGVVYIAPPDHNIELNQGCFRLSPQRAGSGPQPSINSFFQSIAQELGEHAIGIVLSGTGSDGADGLRAIKAAHGTTIAQKPESARFDSMPRAAIQTGTVDLILAPDTIGPALARLLRDSPLSPEDPWDTEDFATINSTVQRNTSFRLDDYKFPTVRRRILRRMSLIEARTLNEYKEYLKQNREESDLLVRDITIGVTSFFRDQEAFSALERALLEVLERKTEKDTFRCWVPACSSGEEAYSIAMLLEEALLAQGKSGMKYVIFATDLDEGAIERARSASYSAEDLEPVPGLLRDRYLEPLGDRFRFRKQLRNNLVFARHNIINAPPFVHLDLISCRNLLIYLAPPVQQRLIKEFRHALEPDGYLFLGKSETAEPAPRLFKIESEEARLYRCQDEVLHLPPTPRLPNRRERRPDNPPETTHLRVLEALVERYAPPSLVIDARDCVVHFQGDLRPYLRFPKGQAALHLFELLDTSLQTEMRALVYRCRQSRQPVYGSHQLVPFDGKSHAVIPVVSPLIPGQTAALLISFQPKEQAPPGPPSETQPSDGRDSLTRELEQELANTRSHLSFLVDELEIANEELQSANEELQSANEELQSINEEFQTSNEELQSTNEELQLKSAELETTARVLNNIKDSLTFPLIVVDAHLRITQTNKACSAIAPQEAPLEGSILANIRWSLDVPSLSDLVRRVQTTGEQHRIKVNGPEQRVYDLYIMPYRVAQGRIAGAVLVFEDITVRAQIEAALRESEERLRLMVTNVQDYAIIWLDPHGHISSWNSGAERIKGYHQDEILGQSMSVFYTPEDLAADKPGRLLQKAAAEGRVMDEGQRVRKDGTLFDASVLITAIPGNTGELLGFAKITRDITEPKRIEAELRSHQQHLTRVVSALNKAKEDAEAANVAKNTFLANMSHEIRTPMNGIMGMVELMLDTELSNLQRDYLESIRSSSKNLLDIINDILDFSKIEAGQLAIEEQDFSLHDVLARTLKPLTVQAQIKGLRFHYEVSENVPDYLCSAPVRLSQVVLNLVGNAIKFTEQGEVHLRIAVHQSADQEPRLQLTVSDTGIGIPLHQQQGLFRPFSQGDSSVTRRFGGTGLGLAISRSLVEAMKGKIGLESTPGQGSRFWVLLPLKTAAPPAPYVEKILALKGTRVLLIGERAKLRWLGSRIAQWGMVPSIAESDEEAQAAWQESTASHRPYQLVLLGEKYWPEDSPHNAIETLRSWPGTATLPVLILSSSEDLQKYSTNLHQKVLARPATPPQILDAIYALLVPPPPPKAQIPRRLLRVLLVEDNPLNQRIARKMLEKMGHTAHIANHGGEALAELSQQTFDIVLMDVQMPILDGLEATRRIRASESPDRRMPILAITANAAQSDREACLAAGMNGYIAKPFDSNLLFETIEWLLADPPPRDFDI